LRTGRLVRGYLRGVGTGPGRLGGHFAMVHELPAAMELRLAIDAETAGDMVASVRGRSDCRDYGAG